MSTRTMLLACLLPASTLLYATARTEGRAQRHSTAHTGVAAGRTTLQAGFMRNVFPLTQKYCVSCHSGKSAPAGIDLSTAKDAGAVLKNRDSWDRIAANVASAHMPPAGMPAPTKEQRDALVNWVQTTTTAADCNVNDPGHVTLRRLNRAEYNNTVRDLCGVDIHPADDFPNDDVGYGFDNIGDVLSISPLLMEKYVNAAEKVARAVFQNQDDLVQPKRFEPGALNYINQSNNAGDHAFLTTTGSEVGIQYNFPENGDYLLRAFAWQRAAGGESAKMQFKLDGKELGVVDVPNRGHDAQPYLVRATVPAGQHLFSVVFLNGLHDTTEDDGKSKGDHDRHLNVRALEIVGPLHKDAVESALRKQLGDIEPDDATRDTAARRFLADFARHAYRRPVTRPEVDSLIRYVDLAHSQGETYQAGIEYAMTAAMCSPDFLFRIEINAPAAKAPTRSRTAFAGRSHLMIAALKSTRVVSAAADSAQLDDYALASRLSYFLWSSMPDDELFSLAARNRLHDPAVLTAQVKRMLKSPRSTALSDNFAGQWLQLRNLSGVSPDPERYPDFNDSLRQAMKSETELFFESIVNEDRSVLDFLDANYTFLNEQLAKHYDIAGVQGSDFRRVVLTGGQRGGLLTQASLLTVTSNPTRTSPVKRGKWVMENLLGTPLPPAPPNVPVLSDDKKGPLVGTLRQRMEQHRANPVCASCHARMDPIGFGLENFDAVGRWRTLDGGANIDASGVLPDGSKFNGPAELKRILLGKKTLFVHCLSTKLMTYALGRGMERTDRCTIDGIVGAAAKDGYKFSSLITAIVLSDPFRKQRGTGGV